MPEIKIAIESCNIRSFKSYTFVTSEQLEAVMTLRLAARKLPLRKAEEWQKSMICR